MKYAIVAYDRNRAIGADNDLPWMGKMKADMQRVRDLTRGNAIIMGRRTFESIGRALPNKQNIVVSSQNISVPDVITVGTLEEAYKAVGPGRKTFIFGGGKLYESSLDSVDKILATEIDTKIDGGDAFFPILGDEWREVSREHHEPDADNIYPYDFVTYQKV